MNVAEEDMRYVVAMNRMRGAYLDLDPGIAPYLLASTADDRAGLDRTYSFLRRRTVSHLLGSSGILLLVVDASVWGLFAGGLSTVAGAANGWAIAIGVTVGVILIVGSAAYAQSTFVGTWRRYLPRKTTAGPPPYLRDDR